MDVQPMRDPDDDDNDDDESDNDPHSHHAAGDACPAGCMAKCLDCPIGFTLSGIVGYFVTWIFEADHNGSYHEPCGNCKLQVAYYIKGFHIVSHATAGCGDPAHFRCDGGTHGERECHFFTNHHLCEDDGLNHNLHIACYRFFCDLSDGPHGQPAGCPPEFGHCTADGKNNHKPAGCDKPGHYDCKGLHGIFGVCYEDEWNEALQDAIGFIQDIFSNGPINMYGETITLPGGFGADMEIDALYNFPKDRLPGNIDGYYDPNTGILYVKVYFDGADRADLTTHEAFHAVLLANGYNDTTDIFIVELIAWTVGLEAGIAYSANVNPNKPYERNVTMSNGSTVNLIESDGKGGYRVNKQNLYNWLLYGDHDYTETHGANWVSPPPPFDINNYLP